MCEGWLVTVCLSEHKWTLLSLLAQLFQTLSMLCVPSPANCAPPATLIIVSLCQPRGSVIAGEAMYHGRRVILRSGKAPL